MELLAYWRILKRRLWIPVLLLILVALAYVVLTPQPAPVYSASMRFVVGVRPEPASVGDYYRYDRYYTWLTAEYLLDDLAEVVKSHAFAQDVAQQAGLAVPTGAIQGATSAGKLHRVLSVSVTWHNSKELAAISSAVVAVLQHNAGRYFAQLSTEDAVVSLIDPPVVAQVPPSLRRRLDMPLRLVLALLAGVALAFALHYVDPSVRSRQEIESLGLPVLAQVPSQTKWSRPLRRHTIR